MGIEPSPSPHAGKSGHLVVLGHTVGIVTVGRPDCMAWSPSQLPPEAREHWSPGSGQLHWLLWLGVSSIWSQKLLVSDVFAADGQTWSREDD